MISLREALVRSQNIPQEEKFENTARVDGNLQGDSDTHSRTSLSSKYDDTDDDLLDSDWETRPVAELEDDSKYEREDWDKELCDACPYDFSHMPEDVFDRSPLGFPVVSGVKPRLKDPWKLCIDVPKGHKTDLCHQP
ncbi:hypothetical protein NDU88_008041 [Pleurodeles waltl]|uniref:Uncharacterized protein n=1 Tax=Pleurodeles waltl TaxID=8319 RepID=A0AAV7PNM5_PLEWA|nr:hypothetical protein NDU88_008041 [Pleurodeles waltl]